MASKIGQNLTNMAKIVHTNFMQIRQDYRINAEILTLTKMAMRQKLAKSGRNHTFKIKRTLQLRQK